MIKMIIYWMNYMILVMMMNRIIREVKEILIIFFVSKFKIWYIIDIE